MARLRDPDRPNKYKDKFGNIGYGDIAPLLMCGRQQRLVPFLGAGASRPGSSQSDEITAPADPALLDELAGKLAIQTEEARLFLEIAVAVVARLNAPGEAGTPPGGAYDAVCASKVAPSAAELAQALAEKSGYDYFARAKERVIDLTGRENWDDAKLTRLLASLARLTAIGSPVPPLLDASSYSADRNEREVFWSDLHQLFKNKRQRTPTHDLVAEAASRYIKTNDDPSAQDFLIITTNYDRLLEDALDAASVPYYVLTVPNGTRPTVDLHFSDNVLDYLKLSLVQFDRIVLNITTEGDPPVPKTAKEFGGFTNKIRPLVIVYKIHGSLDPGAARDSVVITNEDYVSFLSVAPVPGHIRTLIHRMGLLLLGYSFNDWNIRTLYRSVSQYRTERGKSGTKDYAVLLNPSPYETGFFELNRIDILDTTLDLFCERMREVAC